MTFGKDPRTYDVAPRILNEEIEREAWFIELLAARSHSSAAPDAQASPGSRLAGALFMNA